MPVWSGTRYRDHARRPHGFFHDYPVDDHLMVITTKVVPNFGVVGPKHSVVAPVPPATVIVVLAALSTFFPGVCGVDGEGQNADYENGYYYHVRSPIVSVVVVNWISMVFSLVSDQRTCRTLSRGRSR